MLAGKPGSETIVKDPLGRSIDVIATRPEEPGDDVFLTLDHRLQAQAEQVLRETVSSSRAQGRDGDRARPATGAVLAMATAPGFDANRFGKAPPDRRRNRAVTDTYEPGSTFKLVTVSAALSERLVTPTTPFTLPTSIQVADRVIHEHEPRATQRMTVAQILSQSSNVGTITLAQLLGQTRLDRLDRPLRLRHARPAIDFSGRVARASCPSHWSGSTIGNVPIGQGIAVTPIQMAAAYAAIANGGVLRSRISSTGSAAGDRSAGRAAASSRAPSPRR